MNYVIGSGGQGSYMAPALCKLVTPKRLTLIDGDSFEEKNLDRQLFDRRHIGHNKASSLARLYGCGAISDYFAMGRFRIDAEDVLIVAVDNHPARVAALNEADIRGCRVIISANERTSAEAYYYQKEWKETPLDPRTMYPELLTDHSGDPIGQAIGCIEAIQGGEVQTASANFMGAALALHLFTVWIIESPNLDKETLDKLPHLLRCNFSKLESKRVCDSLI
jgi:hypothetical protein